MNCLNLIFGRGIGIFAIIFCLLNASCISKKEIVYFQSKNDSVTTSKQNNYTPILKCDDFLSINVMGIDQEAIKPFNLPINQLTNNSGGYTTGTPSTQGYLIDANGNIDFPVIGQIKLAGLDRMVATALIKEKLNSYLSNPIVNIKILNFKITVLGEVKTPGTFTIPNERITLPEAFGLAGDLNITGLRKNVMVMRDVNGKKTEYRVDLTSKNLFSSPVYYLNQNDLVYVEPSKAKINSSAINPANASILISAVSLVVTLLALLTR